MLSELLITIIYILLLIHIPLFLYKTYFELKHKDNFEYYSSQYILSCNNNKPIIIFKSYTECTTIDNGIQKN